jgi:integrase
MVGRDPATGKRVYKEWRGDTQDDCRAAKLQWQIDQQNGVTDADRGRARQTVREFGDRWLATIQGSVEPRTYQTRCHLLRRWLYPALGNVRLRATSPTDRALMPDDLTRLYVRIALLDPAADPKEPRNQRHPATARDLHACVRKMLNDALKWGDVTRNVALAATVPSYKAPERTPPAGTAVRRLRDLAEAEGDPLVAWWALAGSGGMRPEELLGLEWPDVKLDERRIEIVHARETQSAPVPKPLKSEKSRRSLPLTRRTVEILERHRERQRFAQKKAGLAWQDNNLVFCTADGRPLWYRNVYRAWAVAKKRADFPAGVRPYDLRHAYATELLAEGVPLHEVSWLMGHASSNFTADRYAHRVKRRDDAARSAIERAMGDD